MTTAPVTKPATGTRLAVIGDVGGHPTELRKELLRLGANPDTGTIPNDLIICQVGDLIHRGPDSTGVINIVEQFRHTSSTQWIQLVGNHEAYHLGENRFYWPAELTNNDIIILQDWYATGFLKLAAAFTITGVPVRRKGGDRETIAAGDLLITHAGLTRGFYEQLGHPKTAAETAALLNEASHDVNAQRGAFAPGVMLGMGVRRNAGITWAVQDDELTGSWLLSDTVAPFAQAHGHSSAFNWFTGQWGPRMRTFAERNPDRLGLWADRTTRHTRLELMTTSGASSVIFGTDPYHGQKPAPNWQALEFTLTR